MFTRLLYVRLLPLAPLRRENPGERPRWPTPRQTPLASSVTAGTDAHRRSSFRSATCPTNRGSVPVSRWSRVVRRGTLPSRRSMSESCWARLAACESTPARIGLPAQCVGNSRVPEGCRDGRRKVRGRMNSSHGIARPSRRIQAASSSRAGSFSCLGPTLARTAARTDYVTAQILGDCVRLHLLYVQL